MPKAVGWVEQGKTPTCISAVCAKPIRRPSRVWGPMMGIAQPGGVGRNVRVSSTHPTRNRRKPPMMDDPDQTRRSLLYASGAALLTNALSAAPAFAQGAAPAKPAAKEFAGEGRAKDEPISPVTATLARYVSRRSIASCRRRDREDQAARARYPRRDGVGLAAQGRRAGGPLCRTASAASRRRR